MTPKAHYPIQGKKCPTQIKIGAIAADEYYKAVIEEHRIHPEAVENRLHLLQQEEQIDLLRALNSNFVQA